jgi:hypothetical protein
LPKFKVDSAKGRRPVVVDEEEDDEEEEETSCVDSGKETWTISVSRWGGRATKIVVYDIEQTRIITYEL